MQEATATKCAMAAAGAERLQAELVSFQEWRLFANTVNDVPYSQQQRGTALFSDVRDSETDAEQQRGTRNASESPNRRERRRVNSLAI